MPRVLEGRALLAVVCHGALRVVRAVRLKSTGPGRGVRVRLGRVALQLENNCKCSQATCTVVSATCNSHVLLHRQCLWVRTGPPPEGVECRLGSSIIKTAFPKIDSV